MVPHTTGASLKLGIPRTVTQESQYSTVRYCRSTEQDVLKIIASQYLAALILGFANSATVQPVIAIERPVFYRERAAGMIPHVHSVMGTTCPLYSFMVTNIEDVKFGSLVDCWIYPNRILKTHEFSFI